jgi:GalNAc-alpha-(1->4)-GalNAc-alpha-(1->3)-diNAcBac-PP-undecaprenol alpha-1,4-N-acetyl-D-galactosaminyltransferase
MSEQRKTLCLVIPSLQPGGMERVMAELANYFVSDQHLEVHLVLYGIKRDVFYTIDERIIVHRPSFPFNNRRRIRHTLKTLIFLRKKFQDLKPDTILSFGEVWNNFVLLASLGLSYPLYVSDRCQPDKKWSRLQRTLRRWLYPTATGLIAQTQKAKEIYRRLYKNLSIHVIGNPIRSISPDPTISKENIVLSVGRLIETKHHDELIRIFASLNRPDWKLVIVGDDAQKQQNKIKLQKLIKELRVEDCVELTGQRSDIDDFYRRSKIFAFTSSSEGFPNVIGEAMSAGLPVVAYDCVAGPSDLIEHEKTGFLVELHDTVAFEQRLSQLMQDEKKRTLMGEESGRKIKEFATPIVGAQFQTHLLNESSSN